MGITFFHTTVSDESIELATKVLASTHLSEGRMVGLFEETLAVRLGLRNPVAVNSGTAALHLALAIAGVGPGDEVILPPQTFIATGLVVLMQGATPVFADIQVETGNIDPEAIRQKLTPRTKAIIPVHWAGYPCDMDEIHAIAGEHSLTVIEDAAHALGSTYKGRPVGTLSPYTAFSFQAIKHLTTGDGGALCCREDAAHREARKRRWFGIDRDNSPQSILGERQYDVSSVGYKYHLNDLGAAVGLGNIDRAIAALGRRREIAQNYRLEFGAVPGLRLLDAADDRSSANWLFTILVEDRLGFVTALRDRGIPASVVHQRIDRNSVFGGVRRDLPNQSCFDDRQVSLPVHDGLTPDDVDGIIRAVQAGW